MDQNMAAVIADAITRTLENQIKHNHYRATARDLETVQDVIYWMLRQTTTRE